MPTRRALNERLEALQAELAASTTLSPDERERIAKLLGDVRRHAEGNEDEGSHPLAERLHEATAHFEQSHPNLTLAIGAVADALSRLGI